MKLITEASAEKLRGGFYTPEPIAEFILRWGVNGSNDYDILEPSCGDGVFLEQLQKHQLKYKSITAIEFDEAEAIKANKTDLHSKQVINADFHAYCNNTLQRFDLIVGNPPYIRYQFFDKMQQVEAGDIFIKAGLTYSKLTNAWVSFVIGSSLLLKDKGGKIGFVLPAEILQVSYAQQLRNFIAHFYNKINIISFEKLVFPDIQQEVVLLLCEKNGSKEHNIEHIELHNASELKALDVARLKSPKKKIDFRGNKWTFYFLEQEEIDFLESIAERRDIPLLGKYANVEVGITTGANSFFTVPLTTIEEYDLHDYAKPMVGRSVQVNSVVFTESDWKRNKFSKAKAHLLVFPDSKSLNKKNGAVKYIAQGENMGIHKGYKTSIRDDWFVVPSLKISDALFIRRNNLYPRLIINQAQAYTTDTMHRVFVKAETNIEAFTASYYNSLSLAFTEVCGRSHGGGVLELMPNEAKKILLPYHKDCARLLPQIDQLMRSKGDIDDVLKITNEIILKQHYGLTKKEINLAHNIWKKLSARRLNRGKQ
ncbi:adenine-specific DNA methylase [Anseongella ginsenosidimutans]|uniref:site-specific DNA-methyltransferase (adenine-specific) n=1 Tax=Anseongella ginsenosidimutans TaxID=496056 RepID=A0A4R3KZ97_9SPHI|nr:class I SAM-dependent methyltransferase [Anseongella ginsenosidimutans]QEC50969.1 class I SAM-dependent methyltransferase [Anseongella ginsenosidimutans]TCS90386.1 adenine-specific DNA methylase [Anseongella ginsenosidimutans]